MKHFRGLDPVEESGSSRLKEWSELVSSRPSVARTLADRDRLIESYRRYAEGTSTSQVAQAVRQGNALP